MKTKRILLIGLALAVLALVPAWADGDPLHPPVFEATPSWGSCQSPIITMSNVDVGSQSASLTLTNNTDAQARSFLTFHATLNGVPHLIWLPIVLPPRTYINVGVTYLKPIDPPVIILCGDKPVGIVDQPDPLVGITQTPPQQ